MMLYLEIEQGYVQWDVNGTTKEQDPRLLSDWRFLGHCHHGSRFDRFSEPGFSGTWKLDHCSQGACPNKAYSIPRTSGTAIAGHD